MERYQNTAQDKQGNAISNAQIRVYEYPGGVQATVYDDNDTVIVQPFASDINGTVAFKAANGKYKVKATSDGTDYWDGPVTLFDIADGDLEWTQEDAIITAFTSTSVTLPGDLTSKYDNNRAIWAKDTTNGDIYGYVDSSSYSSGTDETTVNIDWTTNSLTAIPTQFYYGFQHGSNLSTPRLANITLSVMTTSAGVAANWAKLATINLGSADNADIVLRLLLIAGSGMNLTSVEMLAICKQTTIISDTESKIQVLSISDTANINYSNFKLVASDTAKGTDIELWAKTDGAVTWKVQELARQVNSDVSVPIIYNEGATWQSAAPSGTLDISSDWGGSGIITPTCINGWPTGGINYEKLPDGTVNIDIAFFTLGTTTNGTIITTIPAGDRPVSPAARIICAENTDSLIRMILYNNGELKIYDYTDGGSIQGSGSYRARE